MSVKDQEESFCTPQFARKLHKPRLEEEEEEEEEEELFIRIHRIL